MSSLLNLSRTSVYVCDVLTCRLPVIGSIRLCVLGKKVKCVHTAVPQSVMRVTNSRRRRLAPQQPIDSDPFGLRFPNTAAAIVLGLEKRRNYRSLPRRDHTATRTDFCATPLLPFRRTPRGHHFLASSFTSQRCPHCTITPHSHSGMKDSRATYSGEVAALQDDSTASA